MIISQMNIGKPFPRDYDRVVVFDLDGTLSNADHREHYLQKEPKDWPGFIAAAVNDDPNDQVLYMNELLGDDKGNVIIIATGRDYGQSADVTFQWLEKFEIVWHQILFRAADDRRPDYEVKEEMIGYIEKNWWMKPFCVFDDRLSVVEKCWVKNGIYCFNVNNGKGNF